MSDPLFNDTIDTVKGTVYEASSIQRDWWASTSELNKRSIIGLSGILGASEIAYQQDSTAKINQLIKTNYDSLPNVVKETITESLISEGELPNPSDHIGEGQLFEVNGETYMECDRCDETFTSEDDFDNHKNIDHGDEPVEFNDAEESYIATLNPNINRHALKEARKIVTEGDQGVLNRDVYFNGDKIPTPTKLEPDDVKGIQGYNDNPNEGLYDSKIFKQGDSKQRNAIENEDDYVDEDAEYDESESLSEIGMVHAEPKAEENLSALDGVCFAEEGIDFVYPTLKEKSTESYVTEDHITDDYGEGDIDSEKEAVEAQIAQRKMAGYGDQAIAKELVIQYGIPMEEALEVSYGVEVNSNDRVANTIFGKTYNECTESERNELKLYSGSAE